MTIPTGTAGPLSTSQLNAPAAPTATMPSWAPRGRRQVAADAFWRTIEFWVYVGSVLAVILASLAVGTDNHTGVNGTAQPDYFRADLAFLYITILSVGYMLSRSISRLARNRHADATVTRV